MGGQNLMECKLKLQTRVLLNKCPQVMPRQSCRITKPLDRRLSTLQSTPIQYDQLPGANLWTGKLIGKLQEKLQAPHDGRGPPSRDGDLNPSVPPLRQSFLQNSKLNGNLNAAGPSYHPRQNRDYIRKPGREWQQQSPFTSTIDFVQQIRIFPPRTAILDWSEREDSIFATSQCL